MSMLKEAFAAGKFGVTAEMAPPKGYDFSEQLEAAQLLNGKVHGVNVTDMQSASLKASSLGLCVALKNAGSSEGRYFRVPSILGTEEGDR